MHGNIGRKRPDLSKLNRQRKGQPLPIETKKQMSISQTKRWTQEEREKRAIKYIGMNNPNYGNGNKIKGSKNPHWKGGISYNRGKDWKQIRKQIWERDNYTCQICGRTNCRIHAHHIIPYLATCDNSPNNLISLCVSCHMKLEYGTL